MIALAAIAAAIIALRRRRTLDASDEWASDPVPTPTPAPGHDAAPAVPPSPRAEPPVPAPTMLDRAPDPTPTHAPTPAIASLRLDEPTVARAGVNLVTATADVTIVVHNESDAVARQVALEIRLISAQPRQDAAIASLFAQPIERPATPPFDLAPGEQRRIRTLATVPRDAITVLTAGERPMFVPVVAIRAVHADGQTVAVHALGIERPGQAKLGPFWLDQPPRMYDTIGVRPHNPIS